MSRPDWDSYFLGVAKAVAERSDCERSKVGAVVVKDRRIRGTGYNGAPAGKPGCETCPRRTSEVEPGSSYDAGPGRCVAVHAEANALLYCNREDLVDATLYITRAPCPGCKKLIDAAGVTRVIYPEYLGTVDLGKVEYPSLDIEPHKYAEFPNPFYPPRGREVLDGTMGEDGLSGTDQP